jgi:hypothetical protein
MSIARAGFEYFAVVFAAGFAFGVARELLITPQVGPFAATLIEAPFMLAVCYLAARWLVARTPAFSWRDWLAAGVTALGLLLIAEIAGSVLLRGWSLIHWLKHFTAPQGALSLALFLAFALLPALIKRARR